MNILFLSTENPYPVDGGHHLRTFYILKLLSKRYRIHFIGFAQDKNDFSYLKNIQPYCQTTELFRVAKTGINGWFLWLALRNLFSRRPLIAQRYFIPQARRRIRQLIQTHAIDVVHVDMLALALYRKDFSVPAILTDHNAEYLRLSRWMGLETNLLKKGFLWLQVQKLRSFERESCLAFDRCIAVSESDKETLCRLCKEDRFAIIPNGVDTKKFKPAANSPLPNHLIWVGGMSGPYNSDAVNYFLDQIWPLIAPPHRRLVMVFIGSSPTRRLLQAASSDHRLAVKGFVNDIRPHVNRAAVFVAPLRSGSGTKLKVLTAMAQGKAIVATPVAVEGIEVTHGKNILVAVDAASFASAVEVLLRNPFVAAELGKNARNLILENYDWSIIARSLYEIYDPFMPSSKFKSVSLSNRAVKIAEASAELARIK